MRFLFFSLIFPILFCVNSQTVVDLIGEVNMIVFYNDGQIESTTLQQFEKIDSLFEDAISNACQMPAYGVSLDNLTKEEMKKGFWLEFKFDQTFVLNEMPFDSLLVKIEQNCFGVNLIRGNDGIYEGRCFYLDLNGKTFDDLYKYLTEIAGEKFEVENVEIKDTEIQEELSENEKEDKREKEISKSGRTLIEKLN